LKLFRKKYLYIDKIMKKFSKVTGTQVGEPYTQNDRQRSIETFPQDDILYVKILDLIDDYLRIRSVGGSRKNILPSVAIEGKEILARKIIELLSSEKIQESIDILQAVTSGEISVDNKIKTLNESLSTIQDLNKWEPQIIKILETIKIIDKNPPLVKYKLTSLSGEEIGKRISAIDTMLKCNNWQNIKTQLQILRVSYQDRLNNL